MDIGGGGLSILHTKPQLSHWIHYNQSPAPWEEAKRMKSQKPSTFCTVQQHLPKNCRTKTSQPPRKCESCVTVTWHTGLRLATGLVRACDDSSNTIRHTQIQHILAISRRPNTSHRARLCCATHLSDEVTDSFLFKQVCRGLTAA